MLPLLALSLSLCPPADPPPVEPPATKAAPGTLAGRWVRDAGPLRITLNFADGRLTGTGYYDDPDKPDESVRVTLDADYTAGPGGLVYGVVTGVDASPACSAQMLQSLAGHPFAMRCRVDAGVVSVSDVRFMGHQSNGVVPMLFAAGTESKPPTDQYIAGGVMMLGGRYVPDDGTPKPKLPAKAKAAEETKPAAVVGAAVGGPLPVAAGVAQGVVIGGPLPAASPLPAAPPVLPTALPPMPAFATPPPLPPNPPGVLPPTPAAAVWVKERPGLRTTLKVADRKLTVVVEMAAKLDDRVLRGTLTIDADTGTAADGTTFGRISAAEFEPGDDCPADAAANIEAAMEKLTGTLFRCHTKATDGTLAVRKPFAEGTTGAGLGLYFAGKYAAADGKPRPPLKPGEVPMFQTYQYQGDVPLPSPQYLKHPPQYFPAEPAAPPSREAAPKPRG